MVAISEKLGQVRKFNIGCSSLFSRPSWLWQLYRAAISTRREGETTHRVAQPLDSRAWSPLPIATWDNGSHQCCPRYEALRKGYIGRSISWDLHSNQDSSIVHVANKIWSRLANRETWTQRCLAWGYLSCSTFKVKGNTSQAFSSAFNSLRFVWPTFRQSEKHISRGFKPSIATFPISRYKQLVTIMTCILCPWCTCIIYLYVKFSVQ